MGTTVSTHGKNEIENLVRLSKGDCVEDLRHRSEDNIKVVWLLNKTVFSLT